VTVPAGHTPLSQDFAPRRVMGRAARVGPATAAPEAMTALWRAHGSALLTYAFTLTLGDWYRAEDIVQETLVRAWRYPDVVGTGLGPVRPWLMTVARHIAIDMWRSRARAEAAEVIIDDKQANLPDPAERIERMLTALDVQALLVRLSPGHRQVIIELYYRDHSVSETAKILGLRPGTVKSRWHYSLQQLRRTIAASAA
jgi:RNA polymerase sigma-70 factor (ECF subfamily)